ERLDVLLQTQLTKPCCDVHARVPALGARLSRFACARSIPRTLQNRARSLRERVIDLEALSSRIVRRHASFNPQHEDHTMRYKKFGRTGLFVSELCLGTMTFGGGGTLPGGVQWRQIGALQQSEAERLIGSALDAGINFIDTADVYSEGQSE